MIDKDFQGTILLTIHFKAYIMRVFPVKLCPLVTYLQLVMIHPIWDTEKPNTEQEYYERIWYEPVSFKNCLAIYTKMRYLLLLIITVSIIILNKFTNCIKCMFPWTNIPYISNYLKKYNSFSARIFRFKSQKSK